MFFAACSTELSVAELALRKRVRESAWFDGNYLDFRAPFAAADRDGKGRLTVAQFQEAIARLGVAMSPQELNNLARRLDTNADGTIDYYEFAKLVDLDPSELYVAMWRHAAVRRLTAVVIRAVFDVAALLRSPAGLQSAVDFGCDTPTRLHHPHGRSSRRKVRAECDALLAVLLLPCGGVAPPSLYLVPMLAADARLLPLCLHCSCCLNGVVLCWRHRFRVPHCPAVVWIPALAGRAGAVGAVLCFRHRPRRR